jgi:hypothetical protein
MAFLEGIFYDERKNLTDYEKLPYDFISNESWWLLLKRSSSTIREGTWPLSKSSLSILLAWSPDSIDWRVFFNDKRMTSTIYDRLPLDLIGRVSWWHYLKGVLPQEEKELDRLRKASGWFYWQEVMMALIEGVLLDNKRRNVAIYERSPLDFISK